MGLKILVTGGCGFIGTRLARSLINRGHKVRVFDNLDPQVHSTCSAPEILSEGDVDFHFGDVRDKGSLWEAVADIDIIFHFAALTGVGQSMYEISRYTEVNIQGTANLLDILANKQHRVKQLIVASSRAVYGEGQYVCQEHGTVCPAGRIREQLDQGRWDCVCPLCNGYLSPIPTGETKPVNPQSFYAISKHVQEQMALCFGQAYRMPVVILRFFNVYGAGQSMRNPYTGILSIFTSAIRNGSLPEIYEDGLESRDFVHTMDVVRACLLAMDCLDAAGEILNIGSGQRLTIIDVATTIMRKMGRTPELCFTNAYRVGDIRHCFADISKAQKILGYFPEVQFEDGVTEFLDWAIHQEMQDLSDQAKNELVAHGLYR